MNVKMFLSLGILFFCMGLKAQEKDTRTLEPFNKVEIKNGIIAELVKSDKEAVDIQAKDIDISRVLSKVKDGILEISLEAPPLTKYQVSARIFYKKVNEISGSSQSEISSSSLMKQDSLTVDLVTGAKAYLDLDVQYLKCRATEGAILTAEGYAVNQDAYSSTGGTLSLFDLESDVIKIKATANGKAKINVDKLLNAESSTGASILYKGDAEKIEKKTSIGGKIEKYGE